MQFTFKVKSIFDKSISIDTPKDSIAIINREEKEAAGLIIKTALQKGASVVIYGSAPDYYHYAVGYDPQYVYTLNYNTLQKDAKLPFIQGTTDMSIRKIRESYEDYLCERNFDYLCRKDGEQYKDPSCFQSFYQVGHGHTTKEKVVTESFLLNVVVQCAYGSPLHEVVLLLYAPLKPVTATVIRALEQAPLNVSPILMYKDSRTNDETFSLYADGGNIHLKARKKTFEVIDE